MPSSGVSEDSYSVLIYNKINLKKKHKSKMGAEVTKEHLPDLHELKP